MSKITFSQKLKRLEEVVSQLESSDVELEDGLKLLEEGVELHKECQQLLTQTQAKITKLLSSSANVENETLRSDINEKKAGTATLFESEAESKEEEGQPNSEQLPF
jgi:exodeoxyribonuclease VII small subunit